MSKNKINIFIIGAIIFIVAEITFSLIVLIRATRDVTPVSDKKAIEAELFRIDTEKYKQVRQAKFQNTP